MKTLDLNAYGVSEMNQQELVETNGGLIFTKAAITWFVAGILVSAMLDSNAVDSFNKGFEAARR